MNVLLIDNFDSFVYNLYQYLCELGCSVDVIRNNEVTIEKAKQGRYNAIVISPGPGSPASKLDFGVSSEIIEQTNNTPILGVCLGHQGIITTFGGKIKRLETPMHGKVSLVKHNGEGIFKGITNPLRVTRYHSLVGEEASLPSCLEISARSLDDGAIMAVQHRQLPIFGLQFHPEAILTQDGKKMLYNFLYRR